MAETLDSAVARYLAAGWVLVGRTGDIVQLKKPKQFNWLWFIFWCVISFFIIGGLGLLYIIYYLVKKDEIMTLSVSADGQVLTNGMLVPPPAPVVPPTPEQVAANTKRTLIIVAVVIGLLILGSIICSISVNNNVPAALLPAITALA